MIRPKNETEDSLVSITKNCETLIKQTHRKAEETLEFKLSKPKETFQFNPPIEVKEHWRIAILSSEVYNSIYNINATNNKFELYTDSFDEFLFEELEDELEEILTILDITSYHLQHEKIGPCINQAYRKLRIEKSSTDGYIILIMGYARSLFRDFESYLRIVVGLNEDDIPLILKQFNEKIITYQLSPGIYSIEDISKAVYTMGDHGGTLQIEYDDDTMKTKLILTCFGSTFGTLRFGEKSFFIYFFRFYTILVL